MARRSPPVPTPPEVTTPAVVKIRPPRGFGTKKGIMDQPLVLPDVSSAKYGKTRERPEKKRTYAYISETGMPPAHPSDRPRYTPSEYAALVTDGLRPDLTGADILTFNIPVRRSDESSKDWLWREDVHRALAEWWAVGVPLVVLARACKVGSQIDMHLAKKKYKEIWDAARETKAQGYMDAASADNDDVRHNRINPDVARVRLNHHQFLAERYNPAEFSPKVKTELTGANGGAVQVEQVAVDRVLARLTRT